MSKTRRLKPEALEALGDYHLGGKSVKDSKPWKQKYLVQRRSPRLSKRDADAVAKQNMTLQNESADLE